MLPNDNSVQTAINQNCWLTSLMFNQSCLSHLSLDRPLNHNVSEYGFVTNYFRFYWYFCRCSCLQVGDRIVSVNHQSNLTLQEITSILEMGADSTGGRTITLTTEFDVAGTIVPSSGVFTVRMARRGPNLGITITGNRTSRSAENSILVKCKILV